MRTLFLLLFIFSLSKVFAQSRADVAIIPFNFYRIGSKDSRGIMDSLREHINKVGTFSILDEFEVTDRLESKELPVEMNCPKLSCAISMGEVLEVPFIIHGFARKLMKGDYLIKIQMADVDSWRLINDVQALVKKDNIDSLYTQVIPDLAKRLSEIPTEVKPETPPLGLDLEEGKKGFPAMIIGIAVAGAVGTTLGLLLGKKNENLIKEPEKT
ncbi:MAG: hypothetical protein ABIA63_10290, partial [bacterium]